MKPKLKKSHLNKIITKQIFVPSTSLLDHIPLSQKKIFTLEFGWNQDSKKSGRGNWKSFRFCKDSHCNNISYIKTKVVWKIFKVIYKFKNTFQEQSVSNFE